MTKKKTENQTSKTTTLEPDFDSIEQGINEALKEIMFSEELIKVIKQYSKQHIPIYFCKVPHIAVPSDKVEQKREQISYAGLKIHPYSDKAVSDYCLRELDLRVLLRVAYPDQTYGVRAVDTRVSGGRVQGDNCHENPAGIIHSYFDVAKLICDYNKQNDEHVPLIIAETIYEGLEESLNDVGIRKISRLEHFIESWLTPRYFLRES